MKVASFLLNWIREQKICRETPFGDPCRQTSRFMRIIKIRIKRLLPLWHCPTGTRVFSQPKFFSTPESFFIISQNKKDVKSSQNKEKTENKENFVNCD
jgi:hypothetical protein